MRTARELVTFARVIVIWMLSLFDGGSSNSLLASARMAFGGRDYMMRGVYGTRRTLRSAPLVAMVQTANLRNGDDPPSFRQLDRPRLGRVLLQSEVRAASMIIGDEAVKMAPEAGFVEHDHMVQAFATKSANHTFNVGALPWRALTGRRV